MIGVYKIVNKITGDYYIGSSINVEKRWRCHRSPSRWKQCPNNQMYIDMQKYGRDKFTMEIIEELPDADTKTLHSREQYWLEELQPVYNTIVAYTSLDTKQYQKQYYIEHIDKKKQYYIEHADKIKQQKKQYYIEHIDKKKQYDNQYNNQKCIYNGEILTLNVLKLRFKKQGIEYPTAEAKKYLTSQRIAF